MWNGLENLGESGGGVWKTAREAWSADVEDCFGNVYSNVDSGLGHDNR
jgi:hypothetical protein